jgi:hypothetical protein
VFECSLLFPCDEVKPLNRNEIWRRRVEVESTIRPAKGRIAGFEGREGHRTPFASTSRIASLQRTSGESEPGAERQRVAGTIFVILSMQILRELQRNAGCKLAAIGPFLEQRKN